MSRIAPETRVRARRLRHDMTEMEKRVWRGLREVNRATGCHFRRQAPIGPYVVDFADYSARLVIEIDGGQHGPEADGGRSSWLKEQGFRVVRFWNSDVAENLEGVLETVLDVVSGGDAPYPLPPHKGEGSADCDGSRRPSARHAEEGSSDCDGSTRPSPPPCGEGPGVGGPPRQGDET